MVSAGIVWPRSMTSGSRSRRCARAWTRPRHRRGEHHRLALRREPVEDALDVGQEAHVDHAIRLVEDEGLHAGESAPVRRRSRRRPTVATTTSAPAARRSSWAADFTPPIRSATRGASVAAEGARTRRRSGSRGSCRRRGRGRGRPARARAHDAGPPRGAGGRRRPSCPSPSARARGRPRPARAFAAAARAWMGRGAVSPPRGRPRGGVRRGPAPRSPAPMPSGPGVVSREIAHRRVTMPARRPRGKGEAPKSPAPGPPGRANLPHGSVQTGDPGPRGLHGQPRAGGSPPPRGGRPADRRALPHGVLRRHGHRAQAARRPRHARRPRPRPAGEVQARRGLAESVPDVLRAYIAHLEAARSSPTPSLKNGFESTIDEFLHTVRTGTNPTATGTTTAGALRAQGAEDRAQRPVLLRERQEVQEVPRQGMSGDGTTVRDPVPVRVDARFPRQAPRRRGRALARAARLRDRTRGPRRRRGDRRDRRRAHRRARGGLRGPRGHDRSRVPQRHGARARRCPGHGGRARARDQPPGRRRPHAALGARGGRRGDEGATPSCRSCHARRASRRGFPRAPAWRPRPPARSAEPRWSST